MRRDGTLTQKSSQRLALSWQWEMGAHMGKKSSEVSSHCCVTPPKLPSLCAAESPNASALQHCFNQQVCTQHLQHQSAGFFLSQHFASQLMFQTSSKGQPLFLIHYPLPKPNLLRLCKKKLCDTFYTSGRQHIRVLSCRPTAPDQHKLFSSLRAIPLYNVPQPDATCPSPTLSSQFLS